MTPMNIRQEILDQIIDQAAKEQPLECCGYLAGKGHTVTRAFPMENLDRSPVHYSFHPAEQFKVTKAARREKLEILAVYHSHPESPAEPSAEDIRLAFDPAIRHVIISLEKPAPSVRAFTIKNGKVHEEELQTL